MNRDFSRRLFLYRAAMASTGFAMLPSFSIAQETAENAASQSESESPFCFRELPAENDGETSQNAIEMSGSGRIELSEFGSPIFVYNYGEQIRPEIKDSRNCRACYLHPVYGMSGEVLTDDFPLDHFHHHGLFWGWLHVKFDGLDQEYDNWTHPEKLRFRHTRWIKQETKKDRAILAMENQWFFANSPEESLCQEQIQLTVFPKELYSEKKPEYGFKRIIDFEGSWTPTVRAITLRGAEGKSYGGVNFRFAPHQDSVITVPNGVTKEDLTVARLPWADFTATFPKNSQTEKAEAKKLENPTETVRSGVAIYVHPDHPDFPPTWLTRHYGVLCIGWPGVEGRTFDVGETFTLKYRFLIHEKPLSAELLSEEAKI